MTPFREDWQLMFNNVQTYDRDGSWVYVDAGEMEKVFDTTFARVTEGTDLSGATPLPSESALSPSGSYDPTLMPMDDDEHRQ